VKIRGVKENLLSILEVRREMASNFRTRIEPKNQIEKRALDFN